MIHFGHAFLAQEKKEPVIGLGRRGLWLARRRRR
jgi:hypothetical protein